MEGYHALPSRLPSQANDTDDLELASLDPPVDSAQHPLHSEHSPGDSYDDEDEDPADQSDQALLTSRQRTRGRERQVDSTVKTWSQVRHVAMETGPTLLLTAVSMLVTGKLLERVSHWRAMKQIDELIILIPVILNLKGNLEMNLSARLGTAANVGKLDKPETQRSVVYGNLLLLQVQATVVSFVATCVSFIIGLAIPDPQTTTPNQLPTINSTVPVHHLLTYLPRHHGPIIPVKSGQKSGVREFIMVASTAMSAACLSSLFLGSFMCFLVLLCRRFDRDPDNIAPPIASCLGDLVTLSFVGLVSNLLIRVINTPISAMLGVVVILSAGTCLMFTLRNSLVRPLLREGWSPLFGAMVIEVATGIVLDFFVNRYEGFAILAVAISSLPGNVGSILVSRLSTELHAAALSVSSSRSAQKPSTKLVMATLLFVTLPVQLGFLVILHSVGWLKLPIIFIVFATFFFGCAVAASLLIARSLTHFLWSKGFDPDTYALPVHSALMDLIGQSLLVICFEIVSALGSRVRSKAGT